LLRIALPNFAGGLAVWLMRKSWGRRESHPDYAD
jgi:hypothetical protein